MSDLLICLEDFFHKNLVDALENINLRIYLLHSGYISDCRVEVAGQGAAPSVTAGLYLIAVL